MSFDTFSRGNVYQSAAMEQRVYAPYIKDYLNITTFGPFMGSSFSSLINKVFQHKGAGDRIVVPLLQTFDPSIALGVGEQLEGKEDDLNYVTDSVDIDYVRWATRVTGLELQELRTKFHLKSDIREQLITQGQLYMTRRIVSEFAKSFPGAPYLINEILSYSDLRARIFNAPLDVAAGGGISRARILFGKSYSATQATVGAALTDGNMPIADHAPSVDHIRRLFKLATTGKSDVVTNGDAYTVKESPVMPYTQKTHHGFKDNKYVLFVSHEFYFQLIQDPEWQAQTRRGVIENEMQPSILHGSMYKGTVEGVMIIIVPEFSELVISSDNNSKFAYSAFCGGGAMVYAVGQTPAFRERSSTDFDMHYALAHVEISGLKVMQYPSKYRGIRGNNANLVNHSLIHSFTRVA